MIQIKFQTPDSAEWLTWIGDCAEAQTGHDAAILRGESRAADSALYGRLKKAFYLDPQGPFHGKCVFCEDHIRTNQHGDIEHFRPKGAVVDEATNLKITSAGSSDPHPGYYWLAYDWTNLLPACQLCNQPSTEPGGERVGKRNFFPLVDENKRAQAKGDELHESPLLINPVLDDPDLDLGLDGNSGVMFARDESPRGDTCIRIFGLNLRNLPNERASVYRDTRILYKALVDARYSRSLDLPHLEERYRRVVEGAERFAVAARLAVADVRKELIDAVS